MTLEDAIKELEWVKARGFVADLGIAGADRIIDACDLAIEALEKQIPKKPNDTQTEGPYSAEFDYGCPNCGIWFTGKWCYCPYCGQAIDWSDEA